MSARKTASKLKATKRLGLNRQQLVSAAIVYADKNGIDQLSMRQLASEVGCSVMSLYNHVANKEDLLDGMVETIAAEIVLPSGRGTQKSWAVDLRACIISAYKMMLNHPWAPRVWGRGPGSVKNSYHESILRIMREANFSEELACRGFHALTMHVVGFALQVLELPFSSRQDVRAIGKRALQELSADDFPYLREHIHFHLAGKDTRSDFKYMLDLILEGLKRDHTAARSS